MFLTQKKKKKRFDLFQMGSLKVVERSDGVVVCTLNHRSPFWEGVALVLLLVSSVRWQSWVGWCTGLLCVYVSFFVARTFESVMCIPFNGVVIEQGPWLRRRKVFVPLHAMEGVFVDETFVRLAVVDVLKIVTAGCVYGMFVGQPARELQQVCEIVLKIRSK